MDGSRTEGAAIGTMCRLGRAFVQGESTGSVGAIGRDGIQGVGRKGVVKNLEEQRSLSLLLGISEAPHEVLQIEDYRGHLFKKRSFWQQYSLLEVKLE